MKRLILVSLVGLLLSACGGNSATTSVDTAAHAQSQTRKTQAIAHLTATDIRKASVTRFAKAPTRNIKQQASDYEGVVQSLYIAYFGRPADPNGLANFEASLMADNAPTDVQGLLAAYPTDGTIQTLIDAFGTSKESQTLYGGGAPSDFVIAVFNNLLDRAPLSTGQSYWSDQITLGNVTQGEAALSIMAGALSNTSPQGLLDAQLIRNRIAAAEYFTDSLANSNDTYAYVGAAAAAEARSALATVTAGTDPVTYESTLDGAISTLVSIAPLAGTASSYVQNAGFFTWTGSENDTVVLDYVNNQFSVDAISGVVVDLASYQQLNGLIVDADANLVFNGVVIGAVTLVTAQDGNQVAQFSFTNNGQNGTALISVNNGAYSVVCGDCGG